MQNFQDLIRQASHLKQHTLKKDRHHYQSLPSFLKNSLSYSKKYSHLRTQHFEIQLFTSDNIKRQGNESVKGNAFEEGLAKYEEALAVFRWIESGTRVNVKDSDLLYCMYNVMEREDSGEQWGESEEERKHELEKYEEVYKKHMVSLYLNISLCLTKLNKKQESILSVEEALKIDDNNPKCYYRLGQSYIKYINRTEEDVEKGIEWLERAYQMNGDEGIRKEIERVKKEVEKENMKYKKTFTFMMNNGKSLRDSTMSDKGRQTEKEKENEKDKNKTGSSEQTKKQRSRSAEKKPAVGPQKQTPPKQKPKQSSHPSLNATNTLSEQNKNLLLQKQLQKIKSNELDKKAKTEEKLVKISYKQTWQLHLLQNFILTKGPKILSLLQLYGSNYKDYYLQYKQLYHKSTILYQKTNKKEEKFIDNDGEETLLNFQNKETKEIVNQQKEKIYGKLLEWLKDHPLELIRKYVERYENHRRFVEDKIEERRKKSENASKVFDVRREENRKKNLKGFYIGIVVLFLWICYNYFMAEA